MTIERYYYKRMGIDQFRVYDSKTTVGTGYSCRAQCMRDIDAKTICYFMNLGFPYDPTWNYKSIAKYEKQLQEDAVMNIKTIKQYILKKMDSVTLEESSILQGILNLIHDLEILKKRKGED